MQIKEAVLYPLRKLFTVAPFTGLLAEMLRKNPSSRLLRGICPNHRLFPSHARKTVKRRGISFDLRLSDYMDWLLYFHSDTDSSAPVLEYVNKDNVILDIGGNIGQTALFMAEKTGRNGRVVSFEPFPETYRRFLTNLKLNPGIQNLTVENIALGNSRDKLKMSATTEGNSGQTRIANPSEPGNNLVDVEVMPLSEYLKTRPLQKIDLIKIDVEGFEYNVLKGATDVIRSYQPVLFIELSDKNLQQQGSSVTQVVNLLSEMSYSVMDINSGEIIGETIPGHTDVICFPAKIDQR